MRNQLKKEMDRQQIKIPEMSRRIKCNQQTLYNFFWGKDISCRYIEAMAKELKLSLTAEHAEHAERKKRNI
jgi:hypothetical protein